MPYLDRDIIRSFFFAFLTIILLVQVALLVDVLLSNYRYMFGEGESKLGWVLMYYVCSLPRQAAYTVPVASAVSILWVYVSKARHNELLAWFCGGVSPLRVAAPLIILGAVLSVTSFFVLEYLASAGERMAYRIERVNIQGRSEESITRDRNIFRKGGGGRYYHIRAFDTAKQVMEQPSIMEMDPETNQWVWRVDAESAEYRAPEGRGKGAWTFQNVVVRQWDANGALSYTERPFMTEAELPAPMEAHLSEFIIDRQKASQMSAVELLDYIRILGSQGKPTYEERTYLHEKVAIPLGALVLAILMCGHVMSPASISVLKGFGGGLVWIVVYWIPVIFFREVSKSGIVPPMIGMYVPNIIFMVIGFWLIRKTRFAS